MLLKLTPPSEEFPRFLESPSLCADERFDIVHKRPSSISTSPLKGDQNEIENRKGYDGENKSSKSLDIKSQNLSFEKSAKDNNESLIAQNIFLSNNFTSNNSDHDDSINTNNEINLLNNAKDNGNTNRLQPPHQPQPNTATMSLRGIDVRNPYEIINVTHTIFYVILITIVVLFYTAIKYFTFF